MSRSTLTWTSVSQPAELTSPETLDRVTVELLRIGSDQIDQIRVYSVQWRNTADY